MATCCTSLQYVLSHARSSLRLDPEFNEVHLLYDHRGRNAFSLLRYCPYCGKRFPKSSRPGVDLARNGEARNILKKIKKVKSVEAMRAVLGTPDLVRVRGKSKRVQADPWIRAYEYFSGFETCRVTVREYIDGSLRCTLRTQGKANPPADAGNSPSG